MNEVKELEARIMKLAPADWARLRDWFLELDHERWDEQIAADAKAGRFQALIEKARNVLKDGRAREL